MPAKKTTAKKPVKKPAAKKPARKPYKRKKKTDNKLPFGMLVAIIPVVLLAAFIGLRFTGGKAPAPAPAPKPAKQAPPKTVVQKVETKSVTDEVRLFMFENGLSPDSLTVKGSNITVEADSADGADALTGALKKHLEKNRITVDGQKVLTAEDAQGVYSISFTYPKTIAYPEPVKKADPPAPAAKAVTNKHYSAKLAIVIDDCGYSMQLAEELARLKYPVTFAIIPYTPFGRETAKLARRAGKVVFLHFPMQPKSWPKFDPGKGALFLNMPNTLITAVTKADFEYFPIKLDGANNHTGSAFTESREKMEQAMDEIKKYVPAFLDSRTSGQSVAYDVCRKSGGLKCGENSEFLDNEEPGLVTTSDKQNHVHAQLMQAARKALANGSAIAIGHLRKETVSVLAESFAEIEKSGVQIVPVTDLMR